MSRERTSKLIKYNGCYFSSHLELKYALWVETWCAYIVHPIKIYHGKRIGDAIDLGSYYKVYVPDFLVRNWKNNKAWLVEVKPRKYIKEAMKKKEMALEYLKIKNLDWKFIIATDRDIRLSSSQYSKYRKIIDEFEQDPTPKGLSKREARYRNRHTDGFNIVPERTPLDLDREEYLFFVKYGRLPERVNAIEEILIQ